MKDTWFVTFNLGHKRLKITRNILTTTGLNNIADLQPKESIICGYCTINVPAGDKRILSLKKEIAKYGEHLSIRHDRKYSSKELDEYSWLELRVATAEIIGGVHYNQPYNRKSACCKCGSGAIPVSPLIAQLCRMGKKHINRTAHDGLIVVSSALATKIRDCGLTGVKILPVRREHIEAPDPEYNWLNITTEWPKMLSTSNLKTDNLCKACGRAGHFYSSERYTEWHYKYVPKNATDFNYTWEKFGVWNMGGGDPVGGRYGIIISQRVRQAFKSVGVRQVEYDPIYFDDN